MPLYRGSRRLVLRRRIVVSGTVTPVSINAIPAAALPAAGTAVGASPLSYTGLTIAAGSNIALIATVVIDNAGAPTGSYAATWNGVSMTLLQTQATAGNGAALIFGLRNPTVGAQTLSVSWTNSGGSVAYVNAIAFNNVSQTSDATAFPVAGRVAASGTSTSNAVTIPSSTNDYCVQSCVVPSGSSDSGESDTRLYYATTGNVNNASAQYGVGASSKTLTTTLNSSIAWVCVGVDVAAA